MGVVGRGRRVDPVYYSSRLGVFTPQELNGGIAGQWPSLQRLLAPLLDPDIGFLAWLPVTALLAAVGTIQLARSRKGRNGDTRRLKLAGACALAIGASFLFVFSQTTNVNSGGTVHVSRYALWLLPLLLPSLTVATRYLTTRVTAVALSGTVALFVAYLSYFAPEQPERYVEHSPQANWVMAHAAWAYWPLPEVFVERTLHTDGGATQSAADPDCRIILLVANATDSPCRLDQAERAAAQLLFAAGTPAVWIRRDRGALGAVAATDLRQ
jgi:hypothetical protein